MYQKGDFIVYGLDGVCRVEGVGTPDAPYIDKTKRYYFLRPISKAGIIYIPVDSKVFMRPVISRETALSLIDRIPRIKEKACGGRNQTELGEEYRALLRTHDCTDLLQLIKTTYSKRRSASALGRKPGKLDTDVLRRAEDLLYDEFSVALDIPKDLVQTFIGTRIRELEDNGGVSQRD